MSSRHPYVPYRKPIAGGRISGSRYFAATSQELHAEGRRRRIEAQVEQDAQLPRNNQALFDEKLFPKCTDGNTKGKTHGVTQLDKPVANQPPYDDDATPGDNDLPPPEPPKGGSAPQPAGAGPPATGSGGSGKQQTLPLPPDPVPDPSLPRRSTRKGKQTTRPDNVYGPGPPSKIQRDIERTPTWRKLVGDEPGSS